jgi:hypothetical protein
MTDYVLDLARAEAGVYGHQHEARQRHGEVCFEHRRNVGTEESDPIALLQVGIPQARGEAIDPLFELLVGVAPVAVDHGYLVWEHVGAAPEEAHRCKLRAVNLLHTPLYPFPIMLAYPSGTLVTRSTLIVLVEIPPVLVFEEPSRATATLTNSNLVEAACKNSRFPGKTRRIREAPGGSWGLCAATV